MDGEGKIIGIVTQFDLDLDQSPDMQKHDITGTKIYAVAERGPVIKSVIQNHQKKTKKGLKGHFAHPEGGAKESTAQTAQG